MKTFDINKMELSSYAWEALDALEIYRPIPEALEIVISNYLENGELLIDDDEISPLEMLDIVREILSEYNKQVSA